jgi:hypothetical protein
MRRQILLYKRILVFHNVSGSAGYRSLTAVTGVQIPLGDATLGTRLRTSLPADSTLASAAKIRTTLPVDPMIRTSLGQSLFAGRDTNTVSAIGSILAGSAPIAHRVVKPLMRLRSGPYHNPRVGGSIPSPATTGTATPFDLALSMFYCVCVGSIRPMREIAFGLLSLETTTLGHLDPFFFF